MCICVSDKPPARVLSPSPHTFTAVRVISSWSLPERSDDALRYSVSDFVEHVFVVCTADEELVLEATTDRGV